MAHFCGKISKIFSVDVDAAARIYGKEITDKNNTRFMKIEKLLIDFKLQKSRFRIRDVINHGNIIGKIFKIFDFGIEYHYGNTPLPFLLNFFFFL